MQRMPAFFESHKIDYRVVGSMASMTYGEPRLTIDIDIVADLKPEHANLICESFPAPEYYVSKPAIRDAIARYFQFNILPIDSGLKVDVFVPEPSPFSQSAAARVRRIKSEGLYDAWFGSPEDIILNKLKYFQISGGISEKHLRDIAGIMKLHRDIDRAYISEWAMKLG